jgi:hypothetical protein
VSPKRGDRVTVPPPENEWDVRFGTGEAVRGWEELTLGLPIVRDEEVRGTSLSADVRVSRKG